MFAHKTGWQRAERGEGYRSLALSNSSGSSQSYFI
jgi:hypothetical protein